MFRRTSTGLAAAIFVAMLASQAPAADGSAAARTEGFVAIGGSVTEIVYALGAEDRLIARDSTSLFPSAAMALPDVGYMRQLSPEGVLSVNPSTIVALQGSGPQEAVDVLKKAGVTYVEIPEAHTHQGIIDKVTAVGEALGLQAAAGALARDIDSKLNEAEKLTAGVPERKRVLFILSMQGGKVLASGSDTAADGMIRLAGAVNAIEGFSGYKQLSDEAVIMAKPDAILMMDRTGSHGISAEELFAHPALSSTPAAENKALVRMEGSYLLGFGPRTADAIRDLAVEFYGNEIGR